MKRFIRTRKGIALLVTTVVAIAAAIGAYAYFTSGGSGTGSAKTGTASNVTISQIGAGYDSLVPGGVYHQDQCFQCAQISELGNDVTLAGSGAQRLLTVVVAFRNWGPAFNNVPITLKINNTTNGPVTDTVTPSFPAVQLNGRPTEQDVTFDFTSQNVFVDQEFIYDITFNSSGNASGLNVALSSSAQNLVVGTDTDPGKLYVNTTAGPGIAGDFPSCTTPGVGFAEVTTNCGASSGTNPGAYGTPAQVTAGSADIPAVEFNTIGGIVTGLLPGGPAQPVDFAITNSGSSSVFINQVATSITAFSVQPNGLLEACNQTMYGITGSPDTAIGTVPPGTTIYSPSGTKIFMSDDGNNQDNCEGATVPLAFLAT